MNEGLIRMKILVCGAKKVGKSSLIRMFLDPSSQFPTEYKPTFTHSDPVKQIVKVGEQEVELRILDTMGEGYKFSVTREIFSDVKGVLLVYDITSTTTVKEIENWMEHLVGLNIGNHVKYLMVGNKLDLDPTRKVSTIHARGFAHNHLSKLTGGIHEIGVIESSVKDNVNVQEAFIRLVKTILEVPKSQSNLNNKAKEEELLKRKKKKIAQDKINAYLLESAVKESNSDNIEKKSENDSQIAFFPTNNKEIKRAPEPSNSRCCCSIF